MSKPAHLRPEAEAFALCDMERPPCSCRGLGRINRDNPVCERRYQRAIKEIAAKVTAKPEERAS